MRKIKLETYWKMQNSFQLRTNKTNPFSLYLQKLHLKSDQELNNLTIKEWDEFSFKSSESRISLKELFELNNKQGKEREEYFSLLTYQEAMEIEYPNILFNNAILISHLLLYLNLINETQREQVIFFILRITKEIISINHLDSQHRDELDLSFNLINFEKEDFWIVNLLEKFNLYGYKIILVNENSLILPFWDWTFDLIFKSLNKKLSEINIENHSKFIENIIDILIKNWIPDKKVINHKFSFNGIKGEIDFAFIKNNILYVFENKNILEFSNPIEKNQNSFQEWMNQYIYKGINQLNKIIKYSKNIFKDWKFDRVIPILCTSSRNRFEPFYFWKNKAINDNLVFIDLDSLIFILQLKYGYELIIFYSYFFSKNLHTGLFDFVDIVGNFISLEEKDVLSKFPENNSLTSKIRFDRLYLKQTFESILLSLDKNVPVIISQWGGDYRSVIIYIFPEIKDKKFLFNDIFMKTLNNFNNSEIIKILKFIFKGDAFYEKITKKIIFYIFLKFYLNSSSNNSLFFNFFQFSNCFLVSS